MIKIIKAPFTHEQVRNLNEYQKSGLMHEFTCGNDHGGERTLITTNDGWICPICDYKQDWCHAFMIDNKVIKDNMLVKLIGYAENDEPIFEQIKENEKRISQNV